jgi:hypothetical protein
MSVFDDLDSLRNATPEQKQTRTKKWRRQFVRFPWAWAERMKSTQRASTYRLALLLLYEHWRTVARSSCFQMSAWNRKD